ncbi:hypothetical protein [Caproicibacterium sp. BJN0003]|uniref:hypothetical protein n=1 Tax=Caproicibacterium sp. BJN0003 TaxID=2994078 RepID=UPI002257E88D|nr:hypothetical protein [Caproicibacterium sp. BJN0003]UZT82154.1 hypothetical protein OP489_11910 [Caproicibacterium sp. BJN0003]
MIELTVTKTSENPSVFTLSPSSIEIGGKDSSLIDSLHISIPDEWQGKVIRATFNQSTLYGGNTIPKILNADGIIELKNDVTLCSGDLVIDAVGVDGSVSPSTGCKYTVYSHPKFGGTEQDVTPSEYQQFVAETKGYSDSAQANATAADASKTAAALSEQNAKNSETVALAAQQAAETAKETAETNATVAQQSAEAAAQSEANSKTSETNSKTSEINSANSAITASGSATSAENDAAAAAGSATAAQASANKAIEYTTVFQNSGYHNSIYRGKDISANEADGSMYTNIASGTFDDVFVGDYFHKTVNGQNYVFQVLGCDIKMNRGSTPLTAHHIVVMPTTSFGSYKMNDTNTTDGGYVGSKMYTDVLPVWAGYLGDAFGSQLITSKELLVNATSSGSPSGWSWFDSTVNLMTIEEVLGHGTIGISHYEYYFNIGISYGQFPLFQLSPDKICKRHTYWLRNIPQSTFFSTVSSEGYVHITSASYSAELQPCFLLG